MESKGAKSRSVKRSDGRKKRNSHREKTGLVLTDGCRRIRGYLLGCFSQGKEYHDWDKHQFSRCTESLNPLSVRHVERIVGYYRKRCTEFVWLEIRQGRSTKLRVMQADPGGEPITIPEVRRRLVGYIASTVRKNGVAHVDQEFLRHFWRASLLPPELIHLVWAKTRKMAGYSVRWRGVNNGTKLVVSQSPSPTHFSPGPYSTHYVSEGIKPKTTGLAPRSGGSSAPLRVALTGTNAGMAPRGPPVNAWPPPRNDHPPTAKPAGKTWPPLAVAGRFVSGRKLARLAALLAVTSMRAPHDEFFRVKWIFVYPRNFAWRALREGFDVAEIVAAYAAGVRRSHEDSLDRDRTSTTDGEWISEPSRVPSAAVAYALAGLLADPRDREDRWAAIFARGPRAAPPLDPAAVRASGEREKKKRARKNSPAPAAAASSPPAAAPGPMPTAAKAEPPRPRASVADLRALLERAKLPGRAGPEDDAQRAVDVDLALGELLAWLRDKKDLSPAQFAALPYVFRQQLIGQCRDWKRSQKRTDL